MSMNSKNLPVGDYGRKRKLFERYVDDIICTVKDDPIKLTQEVNDLNPNLEFTLKILNDMSEIAFLDMAVHVIEQRMITCKWYQKQTETGTILHFRSCAPLQHKKNIIEGTIHRLVRCTSN